MSWPNGFEGTWWWLTPKKPLPRMIDMTKPIVCEPIEIEEHSIEVKIRRFVCTECGPFGRIYEYWSVSLAVGDQMPVPPCACEKKKAAACNCPACWDWKHAPHLGCLECGASFTGFVDECPRCGSQEIQ